MGQIITSQFLVTKPFIKRPSFVDGDLGFAPLPIISTTCRVYPDNFAIHPSSKPFWGGSGFGGWTANHCHLMSFWNYAWIYEMVWHPQYSESVWKIVTCKLSYERFTYFKRCISCSLLLLFIPSWSCILGLPVTDGSCKKASNEIHEHIEIDTVLSTQNKNQFEGNAFLKTSKSFKHRNTWRIRRYLETWNSKLKH